MKRLICEMCGSADLLKDGGIFVCQACGCKYTVEEARKMMVEDTVDISGTVRVDNSEFVQNILIMQDVQKKRKIGKKRSGITIWWSKMSLGMKAMIFVVGR